MNKSFIDKFKTIDLFQGIGPKTIRWFVQPVISKRVPMTRNIVTQSLATPREPSRECAPIKK